MIQIPEKPSSVRREVSGAVGRARGESDEKHGMAEVKIPPRAGLFPEVPRLTDDLAAGAASGQPPCAVP